MWRVTARHSGGIGWFMSALLYVVALLRSRPVGSVSAAKEVEGLVKVSATKPLIAAGPTALLFVSFSLYFLQIFV